MLGKYGKIYEYDSFNHKAIRYFSTNEESDLREAILLLVCSELGFQMVIDDYAYKTNNKTKLAIGRGRQWCGPLTPDHDFWITINEEKEVFKTPEEAVDRFFEVWKKVELGEAWVELTGSGCGIEN